ncbi:MAG: transporter suffix domain-containing protein [Methanosarcinales archaeon]|nr:transporter suffix domain-containing protein [Methanosarcinales archaeon]
MVFSLKKQLGEGSTRRWRMLGLVLVVLSFLLYGAVLLAPFLPVSLQRRAALTVMLVISGEAAFWLGALMLGREAASRLRRGLDPRRPGRRWERD